MKAVVKSALGGSSVVLRGALLPDGTARERTLYLASIATPRMGNTSRPDEPFAVESRDALRLLTVGKEVAFNVLYSIPAPGGPALEFGEIFLPPLPGTKDPISVAKAMVASGWAKVKEARKNEDEAQEERRQALELLEAQAKSEGKGLWSDAQAIETKTNLDDAQAFLKSHKDQPIDAVVEQVLNGSTIRARLILSPTQHQIIQVQMAGIRAPRAPQTTSQGDSVSVSVQQEEFGQESRFFAESRLLQRNVTITLLGLPPTATAAFIGIVSHPAGSIAALLLSYGLAKCFDLHSGLLGAERMGVLRKAEGDAKLSRRGVWKNVVSSKGAEKGYEAVVSRIWGGDSISIRKGRDGQGEEKRIFLSSVRQPKPTDPKQAGLQLEAKEALRKRLIGKTVQVVHDYTKPADGQFEERDCCTIKTHNGKNVAEDLVERGLLGVIKHGRDDQAKSSEIDKLIQAEQKAQNEGKGLHSNKEYTVPRIGDASESVAKANSFLPSFKRAGRIPVVVDFVASASRFKLLLPKQDVKITMVLQGISAPRTARNASEKGEPFGKEAYDFVARKALQRDAEILVESIDRSGGFIGSLYINRTENLAVALVKEGYASVSEYGQDRVPFIKELNAAQEEAQQSSRNIWHDYDPAEYEKADIQQSIEPGTEVANKEYVDVLISDIRADPFGFSIQILRNGGIPELEQLMRDFSLHHSSAGVSAPAVVPRSGDLVSARFSHDGQWYRARVLRSNPQKKLAEVQFYDYGNSELLGYDQLRPLGANFRKLEPQAHSAVLSLTTLLGKDNDYGAEALDRFRSLAEGRPLVANIDFKEPGHNGLYHVTLYNPENASTDKNDSINATLVREGLALVDSKSKLSKVYPDTFKVLTKFSEQAKRERAGAFEFGDFTADD